MSDVRTNLTREDKVDLIKGMDNYTLLEAYRAAVESPSTSNNN